MKIKTIIIIIALIYKLWLHDYDENIIILYCLTLYSIIPSTSTPSVSHSLAEAQQVVHAVKTGLGDRVDDVEFLLEHHLTECMQLEYEAANILRRMENAEQDVCRITITIIVYHSYYF